jgi:hypothetical protein
VIDQCGQVAHPVAEYGEEEGDASCVRAGLIGKYISIHSGGPPLPGPSICYKYVSMRHDSTPDRRASCLALVLLLVLYLAEGAVICGKKNGTKYGAALHDPLYQIPSVAAFFFYAPQMVRWQSSSRRASVQAGARRPRRPRLYRARRRKQTHTKRTHSARFGRGPEPPHTPFGSFGTGA